MLKKINKILLTIIILICTIFFVNCKDRVIDNQCNAMDKKVQRENLERANKYLVTEEKEAISKYIEQHNLNMEKTGRGLCYRVEKQGVGDAIREGELIIMEYEVRLLTGELLYTSKERGPKMFIAGRGGVESGLEEALQFLHKGDEAEIIIPSHLAYGLIGDGNKIPPMTPIIYRIEIMNNFENNK